MPTLYTIGHSIRTEKDFLELLHAHEIIQVVDVRTIPKSRHVPWFNQEKLSRLLKQNKISYKHMPQLGGLRHALKNSKNIGWHNSSFRGFADYMQTKDFFRALKTLNKSNKQESHPNCTSTSMNRKFYFF